MVAQDLAAVQAPFPLASFWEGLDRNESPREAKLAFLFAFSTGISSSCEKRIRHLKGKCKQPILHQNQILSSKKINFVSNLHFFDDIYFDCMIVDPFIAKQFNHFSHDDIQSGRDRTLTSMHESKVNKIGTYYYFSKPEHIQNQNYKFQNKIKTH